MKRTVWIGAGLLAAVIALLIVVPAFIDLGTFKQTYLPLVEETLHRRVDVGEVRLTLVPTPSIRISRLRISDDPAFSDHPFFRTEQLKLRLKFWPLLLGRFEVTEFVLEKPVINLLKQPDGGFNYSELTGKKSAGGKRQEAKKKPPAYKTHDPTALPLIIPNRVRINDGQLNLATRGQNPVKIDGIDLSFEEFSSTRPFPYRASFEYPGLKTISLEGRLNYQEEQGTLKLDDTRFKANDLLLPVEGGIVNLATAPRINLVAASDRIDAKPVFQILSVFGLAPGNTEVAGPMGLRLTVSGPLNSLVTEVRGQFKDVKVTGRRALKGNLSGDVYIKLPLAGNSSASQRLQGEGKLVARDGELTNVDLINRVQKATGLIGLSKNERREATTFKTLEGQFTIGKGVADFSRIYLVNPQLEVNGTGTMTLNQPTLNMGMDAALSHRASTRAASGRTTSFFRDRQGRIVVPLRITGRVESPSVNIDSEKMMQKRLGGTAEKGMGSFFKQLLRSR